jgi:hypothetical protein
VLALKQQFTIINNSDLSMSYRFNIIVNPAPEQAAWGAVGNDTLDVHCLCSLQEESIRHCLDKILMDFPPKIIPTYLKWPQRD